MKLALNLIWNNYSTEAVFFSQLLPRHSTTNNFNSYNDTAAQVNALLLAKVKKLSYTRLYQNEFWFPSTNQKWFLRDRKLFLDGVHLTAAGYGKLYGKLRGAVIAASRVPLSH